MNLNNNRPNKKKFFQLLISVNEEILRSERGEIDDSFSLKGAIQDEFGWLYQSGIYLEKIKNIALKTKTLNL